jgi:Histidine kinase-, DNA gyrase B-, and HSP90-like ATPase
VVTALLRQFSPTKINPEHAMSDKAKAEPTKDFFVRMITRDIGLEDCILDLLDNCVDGATRHIADKKPDTRTLKGYRASLEFDFESFRITDNCGGISLDDAVNYAFRFGRRRDAPSDAEYGIGLYGIGMKRAIFKLGRNIEIQSKTETDSFVVPINVEEWSNRREWDFDLEPGTDDVSVGTRISVYELYDSIAEEFGDPVFNNKLRKIISRDYAFIIQDGFEILINGQKVEPHLYELRQSADIAPLKMEYVDEGVGVEIVAGLSGQLPEDTSPELIDRKNVEHYGWFVACNDRIVIAGSKSEDTVWGNEGFSKWHPQYNGFMGIVRFESSDPSLLPWTTTKREIDTQSPLYRRALVEMKAATRSFIDYSNQRKEDVSLAKKIEKAGTLQQVSNLAKQNSMRFPQIAAQKVKKANILYSVDLDRAKKAARALGNTNMPYKQIGIRTFEYFFDAEVGEENG